MVTTNVVKWQDDGDDELTAYCDDDDTDTEIGPCKWDDVNNRLEINCNSVDSIVKWDDGGNNLESRTTDDDCCVELIEGTCCGDDCDAMPQFLEVTFSDLIPCPACVPCEDCENLNGNTYILTHLTVCTWQLIVGGFRIQASVFTLTGSCVYNVIAWRTTDSIGAHRCFNGSVFIEDTDGCICCDNLPVPIDNGLTIVNCVSVTASAYDGDALLEIG